MNTLQTFSFDGNVYLMLEKAAVVVVNKDTGKAWDPINSKNNKRDGLANVVIEQLTRVEEMVVQENVLITQSQYNVIRMYTK